jgi:hypothetical protein
VTRSRRLRGVVVAGVAALAMSACSAHPGSAALVGSERLSDSRVDDVAAALCAAQGGGQQTTQAQELASRAARQGALDVMISSSLSQQFGASQGVEPDQEQVASALSANQSTISALPKSERSVFTRTLRDYAEGQLMLIDIGTRELVKAGTAKPSQEQAIAEGTKLRDAWVAKNAKVKVDPRFGSYTAKGLVGRSGSLSVPVSSTATAGAKSTPSTSWVSSLPASQKCS